MSKDLIILAADNQIVSTLRNILTRSFSLGIRPIQFDIYPYTTKNDPGCYRSSHEFLRPYSSDYDYALVIFDHDGCGQEHTPASTIENDVKIRLFASGWDGRAEVVVISPELEVWIWSDSPHVESILGWNDNTLSLRSWLEQRGFWNMTSPKPSDPKLALKQVLRHTSKALSSSLFSELASRVSLRRCSDPSFSKLKTILQNWF